MLILADDILQELESKFLGGLAGTTTSRPLPPEEGRRHLASGAGKLLERAVSAVLEERGFVHLRGMKPALATSLFPSLADLVGEPYLDPAESSVVIPASVYWGEGLMGNQPRALPFHTDYSMLPSPPRLTMSCCLRADAINKFGQVYIVDVDSLFFGLHELSLVKRLCETRFLFGSRVLEQSQIMEAPILQIEHGHISVRYHRSRIVQGFRAEGLIIDQEKAALMLELEQIVSAHAESISILAGDVLLIDNRRCLHARSSCSVPISKSGELFGRSMQFIFAY